MTAHKGTFLVFGDGKIKVTRGKYEDILSVVLEPGHEGIAGQRTNDAPCDYWTKEDDVVLQFKNKEGLKVLLEDLQEIYNEL